MKRAIEPFVVFTHIMIAGISTCVAAAAVDLFGQLRLGADEGYIVPLCFAAALLAAVITRQARPHDALSLSWIRQRLPELIGLAVVARVAGLVWHLAGDMSAETALFSLGISDWLFGAGFGWAFVSFCIAWFISAMFAGRFAQLEPDPRLIALEQEGSMVLDRSTIRDEIVTALIWLGLGVTAFATLTRLSSGGRINNIWRIVAYFLFAFVLMAQSRLALLRLVWARERVDAQPGLSRRWALLALLFLVMLALVVLPLSTGYARDILRGLNIALSLIVFALSVFSWLIVGLITGILAALVSLFSLGAPPEAVSRPPPVFVPPDAVQVEAAPVDLRPLLLAVLVGGALLFSAHRVWVYRREIATWVSRGKFGARLIEAARWFLARFRAARQAVIQAIANARRGSEPDYSQGRSRPGFLSLNRLSPRERVLFFYRALLRRSAERGLTRGPGQTPEEFATRLRPVIDPEAGEPVDQLTRAYETARYSRREVAAGDALKARTWWERARDALRQRQRIG